MFIMYIFIYVMVTVNSRKCRN